jgi:CubicO group peptidase (beta-lactamase class C family)
MFPAVRTQRRIAAIASSTTTSAVLQRAAPAELGFDPGRLGRIREAIDREVAAGMIPGAVVGIARHGKVAMLEGYGFRDKTAGTQMWADAVFSIASMTKPMVSVGIMMLAEEGRLLLGDPVSKFLPQLAGMKVAKSITSDVLETVPAEREMTVQDLLRHTSGLSYQNRGTSAAYRAYPVHGTSATHSKEDFLALLGKAPLLFQPGTAWEYGVSTDILGFIIEAISGKRLGDFLSERLWQPLGMADTGFELTDQTRDRYARALPKDPLTGEPLIVHHATGKVSKWQSGGGGCVSTAADYLRFTQMLLDGGVSGGKRLLGRKTIALMTSDHLGSNIVNRLPSTMDPAFNGYGFGLGFAVRKEQGLSAANGTPGDYYWSGVYGTYFWNDPVERMTVVAMIVAPGQMRLRYRQLIRSLVLQAIVD